MSKSNKQVALVVGASRGIGRQIAIDLAKDGYAGTHHNSPRPPQSKSTNNELVVVAAKSTSDASKCSPFPPDPNSSASTISTVCREIHESGGEATAITVDTRDFTSIQRMVAKTIEKYRRLDVLVYNSGAIWWASVAKTPMKRFQLMQRVNVEGLYGVIQACLPQFEQSGGNWKGRIIVVSPPIYSRFFRGKTAYAMGKVGMSILTKGLAMDFQREGKSDMAVTSIWPATAVQSAATQNIGGEDAKDLRTAHIFSDAVLQMIKAPVEEVNGELLLDEDFLRTKGVSDFDKYNLVEGSKPRRIMPAEFPNLRVKEHDDEGRRVDSTKLRASKL
jgi:NAD(P)-dependent dehydrogenase (short-subunit alcohol dehydrogenase family)